MAWFMGLEQLHPHHPHQSRTSLLAHQPHVGGVEQAVADVAKKVLPKSLQTPVVPPTQYFTDKLIRDPPPQPSWWSDLTDTLRHHPSRLLGTLASEVVDAFKYVGWTYVDFVDQLKSWDGTWWGLISHTTLLWRGLVTAMVTVGLVQIGPLLLALFRWARILGSFLIRTFELVGEALNLVWHTVDDLVSYVSSLLHHVSSSSSPPPRRIR